MKVVISAATLLAMVSAAQAQTAGFDAISTPTKDEAVPACADYTINWEYTSAYPGTVSIQLLQGASPTTLQLGPVLASGVDNSLGSYTWAVDCALGADATYGIKITYDSDSTGATFQYSNPFSITASSSSSSPTTSSATAATTPAPPAEDDEVASTLYSTAWVTITSCAATVTDCPARSTVVSSSVYPVSSSDAQGAPAPPVVASASSAASGYPAVPALTTMSTAAAPPVVTAAAPYPTGGNSTAPAAAGTGGLPTTTGSGSVPSSSTVVTAGAGRVAGAGFAVVAGLAAAVFAL